MRQQAFKMDVPKFKYECTAFISLPIQEMYVDYFKEHSIPYEVDPFHYNSDFASFVLSEIPGNGAQAGFSN